MDKSGEKLRTPSEEFYLLVYYYPNNSDKLNASLKSDGYQFFSNKVLEMNKSDGFGSLGGIKPSLAICLVIVFLLVYFALWKGPRSTGKVLFSKILFFRP